MITNSSPCLSDSTDSHGMEKIQDMRLSFIILNPESFLSVLFRVYPWLIFVTFTILENEPCRKRRIYNQITMNQEKINNHLSKLPIILICFFLSGFLGLVYEIIWIRKLGLIFGTTVFSMTTVLTAFFGGLALGSYIFGRLTSRTDNPIRIYAFLEGLVGVFALIFPLMLRLFGWLYTPIYDQIYQSFFILTAIRFIFFVLLLIIPTTMMGGTLPLLSQYFIRSNETIGVKSGLLYGINTIGAAIGAFICGFYFIHFIGVDTTNYLAGVINLIVAIILYLSSRRLNGSGQTHRSVPTKVESTTVGENLSVLPKPKPSLNYIAICFFLSGFASLGYEIAWTRYLSLPLANTRYTYTMILVIFLLGTAGGSLIFSRLFDKIKNGIRLFGCLEIGIGLSAFLLVPAVYLLAIKIKYSLLLYDFIASSALMIVPTILMGATFPIVVKIMTADSKSIGISTGKLYAFNTVGCILGSIITGFLLIPAFGIKLSLILLIAVNIVIGFFCLFRDSNRSLIFNSVVGFVTILAFVIIQLSLKVDIPKDFLNILKGGSDEIVATKEGLENTVWITVNQQNQQKSIWSNQTVLGRTITNEPYGISFQIIQGHIPMLLHNGIPKKILGICLGTGQTFGSMLSYEIDKIDLVEISKTIANTALNDFSKYNKNLGSDKRVKIIIEDGRNFVAHTKNSYDIITLEPSPPEEAGIVNLYTKEFYKLCLNRLNKDGIMSQWLPIYNTHPDETARIIKTFISVFPNSVLWYNEADLLLLGFNGEIQIDINKMESLLQNKMLSDDLSVSYLDSKDYVLKNVNNILAGFLMGPKELQAFSGTFSPITDNHPDLEYTFLKYEKLENKPEWMTIYNAEKIKQYLAPLQAYYKIDSSVVQNIEYIRSRYVSRLFAQAYNRIAVSKAMSSPDEALALWKKSLEYDTTYGMAYGNLGSYYYGQEKLPEAISAYEKAVQLLPMLPELWYVLGSAYLAIGRSDNAIETWQNAIKLKQNFAEAYNDIGSAYIRLGRYKEAIESYKSAVVVKPNFADAYYNLGLAYEAISQWQDAISSYQKAVEINPDFSEAIERLRNMAR
jgi:spermidine synthase